MSTNTSLARDPSVYLGGPPDRLIAAIRQHADVLPCYPWRVYRDLAGNWHPLRTEADFAELNQIIDAYREPAHA